VLPRYPGNEMLLLSLFFNVVLGRSSISFFLNPFKKAVRESLIVDGNDERCDSGGSREKRLA
jgi:hypothetical protein